MIVFSLSYLRVFCASFFPSVVTSTAKLIGQIRSDSELYSYLLYLEEMKFLCSQAVATLVHGTFHLLIASYFTLAFNLLFGDVSISRHPLQAFPGTL